MFEINLTFHNYRLLRKKRREEGGKEGEKRKARKKSPAIFPIILRK